MDKSFPHYDPKSKHGPKTDTKTGDYHGLGIEIKSNHPLANSTNYSLSVNNGDEHGVSGKAQLDEVKDPSPRGKGKDFKKKPGSY